MGKAHRLLELMQLLRGRQRPVSAQHLADRMSVSVRTVYRDIAALVALGAAIDGSAGVGYMLRSGFFLPPLMFTDEEIEALVLGARWVQGQGDAGLLAAADSALAKIGSATPKDLRDKIAEIGLWASRPRLPATAGGIDLGVVREAVRRERRLVMTYRDAAGRATEREVWPIALGYFDGARVVAAWCTLRQDFRHFRVDRIDGLQAQNERYPQARRSLVRQWRERDLGRSPEQARDASGAPICSGPRLRCGSDD